MQPNQPLPEQVPTVAPTVSETGPPADLERVAAPAPETGIPVVSPTSPPLTSHNVALPVAPALVISAATQLVVPDPITSPLVAADADLIEDQWVAAADEIQDKQAQDPRAQETAAEQLSRQYLKQRFNLDVNGGS